MKNKNLIGLTIFHAIGLLLAIIMAFYNNYILHENEVSGFAYVGIYGCFLLISFFQRKAICDKVSTGLFNFLLGVKTIVFFIGFTIYGSFGYIFSEDPKYAMMSILIMLFLFFGAINVFVEQIYLNKMICETAEEGSPLNGILTKKSAGLALNFPLIFQSVMVFTIVVFSMQMSFLGPVWLLVGLIGYWIFSGFCLGALRNPSKNKFVATYSLWAIIKNGFVATIFFVFSRVHDMSDTRLLYPLYVGLGYGIKILVIVSIIIDVIILFKLFIGNEKKLASN